MFSFASHTEPFTKFIRLFITCIDFGYYSAYTEGIKSISYESAHTFSSISFSLIVYIESIAYFISTVISFGKVDLSYYFAVKYHCKEFTAFGKFSSFFYCITKGESLIWFKVSYFLICKDLSEIISVAFEKLSYRKPLGSEYVIHSILHVYNKRAKNARLVKLN